MRKRLISVCIVVMLIFSIFGCARAPKGAPVVAYVVEKENTESESAEAESEDATHDRDVDKSLVGVESKQDKEKTDGMSDAIKRDMFTYVVGDNGTVITGLKEEYYRYILRQHGEMEIPHTLGAHLVTEIGDGAFEDIELQSVHFPESIEVIGNSAFRNTGIVNVNFSECYKLKTVGANAFENCDLLQHQYESTWFMEEIGERAFAGNKHLNQVNFWSGDVTIGKDAFDGCGDELRFFVEWSREETGQGVEAYAASNGIKVEYPVATQVNVPSEPLLLTPEIGSFFYGELGGTYDDWLEDMFCSFEKTPDAPNFGFEDWQWYGCSKWEHVYHFAHQTTASSELSSASERYSADNVLHENRELAWAEGAEGVGIGEYIVYDQIVFAHLIEKASENRILRTAYFGYDEYYYGDDGYIDYTQICIVNGYARDEQVWQENGRVKTLMMYVYDQPYARLALEDTINPQYFTLPQGDIRVANGSEVSFKFVIEEIYPGTTYEDTCITGLVIDFGNVPDWH